MKKTLLSVTALFLLIFCIASEEPPYIPARVFPPVPQKNANSAFDQLGLYPVGWSPDGKFAYLTTTGAGGRGGTIISYNIINTITDDIIYQHTDDPYAWERNDYSLSDFELSWQQSGPDFLQTLKKYNIAAGEGTAIGSFPLKTEDDLYLAHIDTRTRQNRIVSYDIVIQSEGMGKKTIFSGWQESDDSTDAIYGVFVCGYFKSPFEERILVIIGTEEFTFEGTEIFFTLSGCKLGKYFEKT